MTHCPTCGNAIAHADLARGTLHHCPHCGWNARAAVGIFRNNLRASVIVAGFAVVLTVWGLIRNGHDPIGSLEMSLVFVTLSLGMSAYTWVRLMRVSNLAALAESGALTNLLHTSNVTPPSADAGWEGYYRTRLWARLTVVALPLAILLLAATPITNFAWLADLSQTQTLLVIFALIGVATVLVSMPLLSWAGWRCPRPAPVRTYSARRALPRNHPSRR